MNSILSNLFIEFNFKSVQFYQDVIGYAFIEIQCALQDGQKTQIGCIKSDKRNCKLDSPILIQLQSPVPQNQFCLNLYLSVNEDKIFLLSSKQIYGNHLSIPFSDVIYFQNLRGDIIAESLCLISIKNQQNLNIQQLINESVKFDWKRVPSLKINEDLFYDCLKKISGDISYQFETQDFVLLCGEGQLLRYFYRSNFVQINQVEDQIKKLSYLSIAALPNQGFFISGGVDLENQIIYPDCYIYKPQLNQIGQIISLQQKRFYHSSCYFQNQVFITGGRIYGDDEDSVLSCCEVYDFTQKKFVQISKLNQQRFSHGMLQVNGKIYVFGGNDGYKDLNSIEIYYSDKWELVFLDNNSLKIRDPYLITEDNQSVILISTYVEDEEEEDQEENCQNINMDQKQQTQYIWKINMLNFELQQIGLYEIQEYGKNIIYYDKYQKKINILDHTNNKNEQQIKTDLLIVNKQLLKSPSELNKINLMRYASTQGYFEIIKQDQIFYPVEICGDTLTIFNADRSNLLKQIKFNRVFEDIIFMVQLDQGKILVATEQSKREKRCFLVDINNEICYSTSQMRDFSDTPSFQFNKLTGLLYYFSQNVCQYYSQFTNEWKIIQNIFKTSKINRQITQIISFESKNEDQIIYLVINQRYIMSFDVLECDIKLTAQIQKEENSGLEISSEFLISQSTAYSSEELLGLLQTQNFISTKIEQSIIYLNNSSQNISQSQEIQQFQCFQISQDSLNNKEILLNEFQINSRSDISNPDDSYHLFVITESGEYKILIYSLISQYFSLQNINQQHNSHNSRLKSLNNQDYLKTIYLQAPPFYRLCSCINLRNQQILLVGGIEEKSITGNGVKKAIVYDTTTQQFTYVQDMNQPRINHQLVKLKNYILAIGGRANLNQNMGLQTVEKYNYLEDKWEFVSSINYPRYNFAACNVNQKIFICGGTHNKELLDSFEVLEGQDWRILPVKLPQRMEGLCLIPQNFQEIIILGGQKIKKQKHIYILNLNDVSLYESKRRMNTGRSHFHAFNYQDQILLLGGKQNLEFDIEKITGVLTKQESNHLEDNCNSQILNKAIQQEGTNMRLLYSHLLKNDLSEFGGSLVRGKQVLNISQIALNDSTFLNIFGDSYIYRLNLKSLEFTHKQPINLSGNINYKTAKYSSACNILDGKVFISGGFSQDDNQIIQDCFIYSTMTNTFQKVKSMETPRFYHYSIFFMGCVYIFAGRGYQSLQKQNDANQSIQGSYSDLTNILDSCEKFNLRNNEWEPLPRLNFARQLCVAAIYQNKVLNKAEQADVIYTNNFFHPEIYDFFLFKYQDSYNNNVTLQILSYYRLQSSQLGKKQIEQVKVYVIGGSNDQIKIQQIEKLDESAGLWETISFYLKEGVESSLSFWISDQEFIILGGEYDQLHLNSNENKESKLKQGDFYEGLQDKKCNQISAILKMQIVNFQRELTTLEFPRFKIQQLLQNLSNDIISNSDSMQYIEDFKDIIYFSQPSLFKFAYYDQSIIFVLENQGLIFTADQKEQQSNLQRKLKFVVKMSLNPHQISLVPHYFEDYKDFTPYPFA